MTVHGDVESNGVVKVEGRVEGTIRAARQVLIGRQGEVKGDIETPEAVIVELRHDRIFRVGSAYLRDETLPKVVDAMSRVRNLAERDREPLLARVLELV